MSPQRLILITGAAGAIGREVARRHAARGFRILAAERTARLAQEAVAGIGPAATPVVCDLTEPADVDRLCRQIIDEWAHDLDVCFLNAGVIVPGDVIDIAPSTIDLHLDVMLRSTTKLARAAAIAMVGRGSGHIVATVSQGGILSLPGSAAYSAAKAGLRAYLGALHLELIRRGVTVSGIYPSAVDTPMLHHEATQGGSLLNFVGSISTVGDVADAVDKAIDHGRAELFVPRGDGYTTRLLQCLPRLTKLILPLVNRIGERGRLRYLATTDTRPVVSEGSAR